MRNVVAVNDVVVPVPLALFESAVLKLEASLPAAALLGVFGERQLPGVVVPGAEEMHCFAVGRRAESEVELNGGHFPFLSYSVRSMSIERLIKLLSILFCSVPDPWFTNPVVGKTCVDAAIRIESGRRENARVRVCAVASEGVQVKEA